jgi:hypothetical protein
MDDRLFIWPCSNANFGIDIQAVLKIDFFFMLLEERLFTERVRLSPLNGMTHRDCPEISASISCSEMAIFRPELLA